MQDTFQRQTVSFCGNNNTKEPNEIPFRTVSYKDIEGKLTIGDVRNVQKYMKQNKQYMHNGIPADESPVIEDMFEIDGEFYDARYLGGGGTKNVFQIEKDDKKYALALCNCVDTPQTAGSKWLDVLEYETENTKFVRRNGFRTNDIFEIIPVKVGGTEFPAILMRPYDEHSFEVADTKNYSFVNLYDAKNIGREEIIAMLQPAVKEIGKLISLGIPPRIDCVNICKDRESGEFHLYLNDLDVEKLTGDFPKDFIPGHITQYVHLAITALCNAIDDDKRNENDYLMYAVHSDEELIKTLRQQVWEEYKANTK